MAKNSHWTKFDTSLDEYFMGKALTQARLAQDIGEIPVGAIVVKQAFDKATRKHTEEPHIIATGYNMRETLKDASAHAEFIAMKRAMEALDAWRLEDCSVYVTLEPCIMCAGLMHQSRISRCVFGAPDPKCGALGSLYEINSDKRLNHRFEVSSGVREEECALLLKSFFKSRRKPKRETAH